MPVTGLIHSCLNGNPWNIVIVYIIIVFKFVLFFPSPREGNVGDLSGKVGGNAYF